MRRGEGLHGYGGRARDHERAPRPRVLRLRLRRLLQPVPAEAAQRDARRGRGGGHRAQHRPHVLAAATVRRPHGGRGALQHNQSRLRLYTGYFKFLK